MHGRQVTPRPIGVGAKPSPSLVRRVFTPDTNGQIFETRDGGESWEIIFETGAASKGEHYRGLAKGPPPMTDLDELVFGGPGAHRVATTKA